MISANNLVEKLKVKEMAELLEAIGYHLGVTTHQAIAGACKTLGENLKTAYIGSLPPTTKEEDELIRSKHSVDAIMKYRTRTGLSVSDSKDSIDKRYEILGMIDLSL